MKLLQSFELSENSNGAEKVQLSLFSSSSYVVTVRGFAGFVLEEEFHSNGISTENYQSALKRIVELGKKYHFKNVTFREE